MREGHGAFDTASGKDNLPCTDMPKTLGDAVYGRLAGFRNALGQRDQIMLPISQCCGAREDAATSGTDTGGGGFDPRCIQLLRVTDQRWAENVVLLNNDHTLARLGCF